ncbi:hypothetical protein Daesc_006180 [Daldinia eschscholtzii]|uniref:AB hydrolase-1 domain-containing protein n=1 Tax=Daldinia eschscholtzii TaxID=292717 RepID=A0AAX6MGW0_9PEZI
MAEGTVQFDVPGLSEPCHTWYKIVGDLESSTPPLVILHGGPGACHNYLIPLTYLSSSRPLVFYDQIGNGRSTHLPEKNGDVAFWSVDLFKNELDNLITKLKLTSRSIDVYGHSWGGMLSAEWASTPTSSGNLRRLVISNSLASMDTWREGINTLRKQLPKDVQETLDRAEERKEFETPEYEAAVEVFYKRHLSLARPWPAPEVQAALDWFAKDGTTYGTMQALTYLVPTLLINGAQDEAQDVTMQPFFDKINKVKWIKIDNAAHFSHVDQRETYMKHIESFLAA